MSAQDLCVNYHMFVDLPSPKLHVYLLGEIRRHLILDLPAESRVKTSGFRFVQAEAVTIGLLRF